jgi:uncharacterized protein (DUF488 family)
VLQINRRSDRNLSAENQVFTVGHSNWSLERLLGLLKQHSITAIADVRSHPHSRVNPQFNRDNLARSLRLCGLRYVFLGKELGARVSDPSCYRDGKVQYDIVARTANFKSGIGRVLNGAVKYKIALLCAEKEPLACHRAILVGRHLRELNVGVQHILEDGSVEDHDDSMVRLISLLKISEAHLFRTREEIISAAYAAQAERIAYIRDSLAKPA